MCAKPTCVVCFTLQARGAGTCGTALSRESRPCRPSAWRPCVLSWLVTTATSACWYSTVWWCATRPPRMCCSMDTSNSDGRTTRSPRRLMMTRCPARLYQPNSFIIRVTRSWSFITCHASGTTCSQSAQRVKRAPALTQGRARGRAAHACAQQRMHACSVQQRTSRNSRAKAWLPMRGQPKV